MPKPTLDDLRAKFEAAQKWKPLHWCKFNDDVWSGYCGNDDETGGSCVDCDSCAGARQAAEDAIKHGNVAWYLARGGTLSAITLMSATNSAVIESYFGAPGPWTAFRDAVKEFCE